MLITPYLAIFMLLFNLLMSARPATLAESPAFANASVRFKHINTEQGLSNSRILSIIQDRQGFIWIGTAEGMDRYDGQDFVHFQNDLDEPRSISNNVVTSIYEDSEGYIWAGTSGGLNRFDPATESFIRYQHDPDNAVSLGDNNVYAIHEDRNKVLWVGTGQGGLDRFDRQSETFTHYAYDSNDPLSLSNNYVTGIGEDQAGTLWVATYGGGLNQLLPGKNAGDPPTFRRFQHDNDPQGLSKDQIQILYVDHLGALWIGTWGGGLDHFDPITQTFTHYHHDPNNPSSISSETINALAEDSHGDLWVGTWDGGLNRFDRASQTFSHFRNDTADPASLSQDTVRALFVTGDDILVAGTAGGGLNLLDLKPNPFHYLRNEVGKPNTLGQNDVRAILLARDGLLWQGTNSGGLDSYDPSTGLFTHYRNNPDDPTSLSNNTVWTLLEDSDRNLWVGTFGGLDKLDRKTGRFTHYRNNPADALSLSSDRIYYLYQDHAGTLWVGTFGGLNRFDPQTGSFTHYQNEPDNPNSLSNDTVSFLYEDGAGVLWVGTQAGLDRLDPLTGKFTRYVHRPDDPTTLSNDSIRYILGDPSGYLWIGTFGGLNRFEPKSGQARHYTMKNGLSSDVVWGILPDDHGNLWLATTNGLNRFDIRTGNIRVFNASDGLFESSFNSRSVAKSNNGEFILGSGNGLVLFSPDQVGGVTSRPPLVFTDFQLANHPVPIGSDSLLQQSINRTSTLDLSYADRVLSFAFVAIEYRVPNNIRYRYVLRGFDTRWSEVDSKRRFVTYTNLEPGSYTFQVQNTDSNGDWIAPGRSISLLIVPPWWQTTWFRLSLAGLLVLCIAGAYGFRVRMLQQRNRDLEEQVVRRTTSLQAVNAELEERITEITTVNQIGRVLSRTAPFELLIEEVAVIINDLFDAVGSAICLPSADQDQVNIFNYHQLVAPEASVATTKQSGFLLSTASIPLTQVSPLYSLFDDGKLFILDGAQPISAPYNFWPSIQPPNHPQAMYVPIVVRGKIDGMFVVARPVDEDFTDTEMTLGDSIAFYLAAAFENSRLFSEERRQRSVAESRSNELSTLLTISQDVSSTIDLDPLLNLILNHLAQVVDFSTLIVLELAGDELFIVAQHGAVLSALSTEDEFPVTWFKDETDLFANRTPLIWSELAQEPQAQEGMYKTFGSKMDPVLQMTRSCLVVPMVSRDKIVGLFWFGHTQPDCYSESQSEYITAVAHQAALAIENAHHYQEMLIAAADKERTRLAQDLHDSVSQSLLSANRVAESLPALWEMSPEKGRQALELLQGMMKSSLAEMRTLLLELRPASLGQKPLGEILRQLCDGFTGRTHIPVALQVNGDAILPVICQITFYQIAQAAFHNIQQHAHASQVTVELNCSPTFVELRIADDGVGFDFAAVSPDRMGLNIIRERAEKIGAAFHIESKPGRGTQKILRYDLPLRQD